MSDAAILDATARVVTRLGPLRFTLADVGAEVGLSAPALLKRFASKRTLLLAMSAASRAKVPATFARRAGEAPLAALHRALADQARGLDTPAEIANGLAFLQLDMIDQEFRPIAQAFFASFRKSTRALLEAAVRERELRRCDTQALARAIEVTFNGSIVSWGVRQDGEAARALKNDIDATLAPFRTRRRGPAARFPRALRPRGEARASRGR